VDAGYLFAEGSKPLSQSGLTPVGRASVALDQKGTIDKLLETATAKTADASLVRIYWYDGVLPGGLSDEQRTLANADDVKFRAGVVNSAGQQKGVDSLIVTDLIELARNHAISDAILLSGDGDLRIAVQIAQSFGVRVHLVSIEPTSFDAQSRSQLLSQEADTTTEWSRSDVAEFITLKPGFHAVAEVSGGTGLSEITAEDRAILEQAVDEIINTLDINQVKNLAELSTSEQIPSDFDSALLASGSNKMEVRRLERVQVTYLRNRSREKVRAGKTVQ
jgi:uncharacterized LabA/DUF88 family protein